VSAIGAAYGDGLATGRGTRDSPLMARRLRVVGGEVGGLQLVAPEHIRPTTDRVREAIFNTLGDAVVDAVVLDLFAGSGALAIEALSRGAARAALVDHDRDAEAACEQNLATTGYTARARVERAPVERFLRTPSFEAPFDLVFCDPPYELDDAELARALDALRTPGWLAPGSRVIVERPAPTWSAPAGWTTAWERRYGDTLVTIVQTIDVAT
jgi:16S rRNA (guanine966-N2)-methyltransferase